MKPTMLGLILMFLVSSIAKPQLIIDHTCTDINEIPLARILDAKELLHIAYGRTSHGGQLTTGMSGLISFANEGGRGLMLPEDIFEYNGDGSYGRLHLENAVLGRDVGYWPDWYNNTVDYLNSSNNSEINVIMWSWCGQVGERYEEGVLWDQYLSPMSTLETLYPDVIFVYMTGHLDYGNRVNTNAANDSIRSFCLNNNKVLYDFADIESYSPDGTCYKNNADDACNYYDEDGDSIGNWAVEYQNSHTEGVDWYDCEAAHSEPINANLKAYAAWWMFASFAGWNYDPMPVIEDENTSIRGHVFPNPANDMAIFELEISGENIQPYVNVISPTGAVIQEYLQPTFTQGKILYNINVSDLPPSIYYISVKCREHYINFKLSVL